MPSDARESLAEEQSIAAQALALAGPRPTLERMRVEAQQEAIRHRRVALIKRVALIVGALSLATIAYAILR